MKSVFADTSYWVALGGENDAYHHRAAELAETLLGKIITTEYILIETGGLLSRRRDRLSFASLVRDVQSDSTFHVVPASQDLFQAGFELFVSRSDKEWSLVDCISFIVMKRRRLVNALTGDRHFLQAGFRALLLEH